MLEIIQAYYNALALVYRCGCFPHVYPLHTARRPARMISGAAPWSDIGFRRGLHEHMMDIKVELLAFILQSPFIKATRVNRQLS